MTIFKDSQGRLHDDMGGEAAHLLPSGCIPATQAEIDASRNPVPTLAQQIAHCDALVESLLDQTAQRKGYKNSDRLAGYANSTNPAWAHDASIFIAWRDAVWSYCTVLLASVQAGTAPAPTDAQLLSGLPAFTAW